VENSLVQQAGRFPLFHHEELIWFRPRQARHANRLPFYNIRWRHWRRKYKGASTTLRRLWRAVSQRERESAHIGTGMPIPKRIRSTTGQPTSCADLWISF